MPNLVWIQSITTGLDHFLYDELRNNDNIQITNSKMIFSPQIAEFVMGSILYFAKDFPRLQRQKEQKTWERFSTPLLCNQSIGIIGYGEIGRAIATLAKGFRMHVIASRRWPERSKDDPLLDEVA
jgi:phosphoglycerate dehydrogenase-like enzyme